MKLSIRMSRRELFLGGSFLIFQLTALPLLLSAVCDVLPFSVSPAQRNFVYFAVSFLCVLGVFHRYLWQSAVHACKCPAQVLGFAAVGLVLYWVGNLAMGRLLLLLGMDTANINDSSIAAMAAEEFPLMLVGTVLLVPLAEETLYRGLLFGTLYQKNRALGYALSTVIFCFIHVVSYAGSYPPKILFACFLQYIPAGLCLGWAYAKADSIVAPILIHAVVNAIGILSLR